MGSIGEDLLSGIRIIPTQFLDPGENPSRAKAICHSAALAGDRKVCPSKIVEETRIRKYINIDETDTNGGFVSKEK